MHSWKSTRVLEIYPIPGDLPNVFKVKTYIRECQLFFSSSQILRSCTLKRWIYIQRSIKLDPMMESKHTTRLLFFVGRIPPKKKVKTYLLNYKWRHSSWWKLTHGYGLGDSKTYFTLTPALTLSYHLPFVHFTQFEKRVLKKNNYLLFWKQERKHRDQ